MRYVVEISEAVEAEIDAAYLWISRRSPELAGRWHDGLLSAIASLSDLPNRCPVATESNLFEEEVRVLLYGRGRSAYRVLFTVRQVFAPNEEPEVRILHVRHGAQRRFGEPDPEP